MWSTSLADGLSWDGDLLAVLGLNLLGAASAMRRILVLDVSPR